MSISLSVSLPSLSLSPSLSPPSLSLSVSLPSLSLLLSPSLSVSLPSVSLTLLPAALGLKWDYSHMAISNMTLSPMLRRGSWFNRRWGWWQDWWGWYGWDNAWWVWDERRWWQLDPITEEFYWYYTADGDFMLVWPWWWGPMPA